MLGQLLLGPQQSKLIDALVGPSGNRGGQPLRIQWGWGELQEFDGDWSGTGFEMRFKTSMMRGGVSSGHAAFVCGAMDEMISNAQEHSRADCFAVATYEVTKSFWMFSVTDFGIGIPDRIRENRRHRGLKDLDAISAALEHGVSTYQEEERGMGYSQVFRALADRAARLRIRSGCGLLEWEGFVNGVGEQQLSPKPRRGGTHVRAAAKLPL
ncbi:sensor histidine kinase [Enhygromyxa salina]|uniref:sensor histidine kinase n=1 Tax=Enhygromyxa salina TaxID=215803 RepID=UPI0011B1EF11|nr:sensor histidine kinase [Enhygromyxa salina]